MAPDRGPFSVVTLGDLIAPAAIPVGSAPRAAAVAIRCTPAAIVAAIGTVRSAPVAPGSTPIPPVPIRASGVRGPIAVRVTPRIRVCVAVGSAPTAIAVPVAAEPDRHAAVID